MISTLPLLTKAVSLDGGTGRLFYCLLQKQLVNGKSFPSDLRLWHLESITLLKMAFVFSHNNIISLGGVTGDPLQYSCLENPMDGGAWWAAVHGVARSRTRLSDFTFTFHFHVLEKEMATHSSVLAWRIPGTGASWAAIYGVAQSRTRLKRLSSSQQVESVP